jgi:protein involved in sex pheromone biosynthesis
VTYYTNYEVYGCQRFVKKIPRKAHINVPFHYDGDAEIAYFGRFIANYNLLLVIFI